MDDHEEVVDTTFGQVASFVQPKSLNELNKQCEDVGIILGNLQTIKKSRYLLENHREDQNKPRGNDLDDDQKPFIYRVFIIRLINTKHTSEIYRKYINSLKCWDEYCGDSAEIHIPDGGLNKLFCTYHWPFK